MTGCYWKKATVNISKNDTLAEPFPLQCCFTVTNTALEDPEKKLHHVSETYVCISPVLSRRSPLLLWKKPSDSRKKPSNLRHSCIANTFRKNVLNVIVTFLTHTVNVPDKLFAILNLYVSVRFSLMLLQITASQTSIWIMHQACKLVSKTGGSVFEWMVLSDSNCDFIVQFLLQACIYYHHFIEVNLFVIVNSEGVSILARPLPKSTVPFGLPMCPLSSGLKTQFTLPALCPLTTSSNHLKYLTRQGFPGLLKLPNS